jgi:hypothetical protein
VYLWALIATHIKRASVLFSSQAEKRRRFGLYTVKMEFIGCRHGALYDTLESQNMIIPNSIFLASCIDDAIARFVCFSCGIHSYLHAHFF